ESNAGRHRLTHPRTTPILSWPDLNEAKRRAESIALSNLPLIAGVNIEKADLARINAANTRPNPMGPPLNRPWPANTGDAVLLGANHRITEARTDSGIDTSIPHFLRRVSP